MRYDERRIRTKTSRCRSGKLSEAWWRAQEHLHALQRGEPERGAAAAKRRPLTRYADGARPAAHNTPPDAHRSRRTETLTARPRRSGKEQ